MADVIKLSAAVITLNEEEKIADCLRSLLFADEIVVIDSGSEDRTVQIAESFGARVIFNRWPGHVEQKNFAIDQTCGEWVLSLDADERVSKKLQSSIMEVLKDKNINACSIPRAVYYVNRWIGHSGWYPARKVRLFRRNAGRWGGENPHDRVFVSEPVKMINGDIFHLSFDNVSDHLKTINSFTDIASSERLKKGFRAGLTDILFRPIATFMKMFFLKAGFRDGMPGFIIASLSGYHVFCKYIKIMEAGEK